MNKTLAKTGRQILKELLAECTEKQHRIFKLMYARDNGKRSIEDAEKMAINDVVDLMEDNKIDWAITQCERTVEKNILQS